jgi:hypothetical protein
MKPKLGFTVSWFVGGAGRIVWTVGGNDLLLRHKRDAPYHREKGICWEELAPVDVVLFQGWRPPLSHGAWSQAEVNILVWFNQGLRRQERLPTGWSLTKKSLSHARAGGITNTRTVVYIAMRLEQTNIRWKQKADGFSNTLRQVIDPTLGGKMCDIPGDEDNNLNTAKGLLDWTSRRTTWVAVPTVYSKEKWLVRKLGPQELGHAINLPGDKIEGMKAEVLDKVLNA